MESDHSEIVLLEESKGMMDNKFCFCKAGVLLNFPVRDGIGHYVFDGNLRVLKDDGISFHEHVSLFLKM